LLAQHVYILYVEVKSLFDPVSAFPSLTTLL
jgi:hypothetical protein